MSKSTITDLPKDIKNAYPLYHQNGYVKEIIKQAEAGEFHDFKNKLYPCGKMQLVSMLDETRESALIPIREAVINGEYDESPDAKDKAAIKKDWIENGGSIELYETMFGKD